jgi:hypothetical protein
MGWDLRVSRHHPRTLRRTLEETTEKFGWAAERASSRQQDATKPQSGSRRDEQAGPMPAVAQVRPDRQLEQLLQHRPP